MKLNSSNMHTKSSGRYVKSIFYNEHGLLLMECSFYQRIL